MIALYFGNNAGDIVASTGVDALKKLKLPKLSGINFRRKLPPLVGIDISSSAVKVLELGKSGNRYRVERVGIDPLPPNAIIENSVADVDAVAQSVSRAVSRSGTKCKHAVLAVPASHVITKTINMPAGLSEVELESQIMFDASRYIPYPLDEVNIDFQVLGPSEASPKEDEILLAACRKEVVEDYVSVVSLQGLTPRVVDVETFAVENAYAFVSSNEARRNKEGVVAMLDIGATATHLTVIKGYRTIYSRDHAFGGRLLTDEIQRVYGLSYQEAGLAKKAGGLPEGYEEEVLAPFKESMAQEAVRALQFFYSSSPYNSVDSVMLAGGTSQLPGVPELLEDRIGASVSMLNPFQFMGVSSHVSREQVNSEASSLLVACGLALRGFDN